MASFEQDQIESLLRAKSAGGVDRGVGLFLMPTLERIQVVHDAAVQPAMRKNGLNRVAAVPVFGSGAQLCEVTRWLRAAQVIVADLSTLNPELMYVVGLAHGLGRCPILIYQNGTELPFNLQAARCFEYRQDARGLIELRQQLARAIRALITLVG